MCYPNRTFLTAFSFHQNQFVLSFHFSTMTKYIDYFVGGSGVAIINAPARKMAIIPDQ